GAGGGLVLDALAEQVEHLGCDLADLADAGAAGGQIGGAAPGGLEQGQDALDGLGLGAAAVGAAARGEVAGEEQDPAVDDDGLVDGLCADADLGAVPVAVAGQALCGERVQEHRGAVDLAHGDLAGAAGAHEGGELVGGLGGGPGGELVGGADDLGGGGEQVQGAVKELLLAVHDGDGLSGLHGLDPAARRSPAPSPGRPVRQHPATTTADGGGGARLEA